jgi:predicted GIY-YIG superfamily endonuclease
MPLNIQAIWHPPMPLKEATVGFGYSCPNAGAIPEAPGVYIFARKFSDTLSPLYVGKSKNLRRRVDQHLNSVYSAKHGDRYFVFCEIKLLQGQKEQAVLRILETALIDHALTNNYELLQKQGTKRKNHTIKFSGTKISEEIAPKNMRVRAS